MLSIIEQRSAETISINPHLSVNEKGNDIYRQQVWSASSHLMFLNSDSLGDKIAKFTFNFFTAGTFMIGAMWADVIVNKVSDTREQTAQFALMTVGLQKAATETSPLREEAVPAIPAMEMAHSKKMEEKRGEEEPLLSRTLETTVDMAQDEEYSLGTLASGQDLSAKKRAVLDIIFKDAPRAEIMISLNGFKVRVTQENLNHVYRAVLNYCGGDEEKALHLLDKVHQGVFVDAYFNGEDYENSIAKEIQDAHFKEGENEGGDFDDATKPQVELNLDQKVVTMSSNRIAHRMTYRGMQTFTHKRTFTVTLEYHIESGQATLLKHTLSDKTPVQTTEHAMTTY